MRHTLIRKLPIVAFVAAIILPLHASSIDEGNIARTRVTFLTAPGVNGFNTFFNAINPIVIPNPERAAIALDYLHPARYHDLSHALHLTTTSLANNTFAHLTHFLNSCPKLESASLWASTYGYFTTQDKNACDIAFTSNSGGIQAGMDLALSEYYSIGAAFAFTHEITHWSSSKGNADVDAYFLQVYDAFTYANFLLKGAFTMGTANFNASRVIAFEGLFSKPSRESDGNIFSFAAELSYPIYAYNCTFLLFGSGNFSHLRERGFSESGRDVILGVRKRSSNNLRTEAGIRASTTFLASPLYSHTINLAVKLAWIGNFALRGSRITSIFINQDQDDVPYPLTVFGRSYDAHFFSPGIDISCQWHEDYYITAHYDAEIGRDTLAHEAALHAGVHF